MNPSELPSSHRQQESDFLAHVERLLDDDRLRIDTTRGRRPLRSLEHRVTRADRTVDLKRTMTEMNRPDRDLQAEMPIGGSVDVLLTQRHWFILKKPVGRFTAVCVSPTRALLAGRAPEPMKASEVHKTLADMPAAPGGVPSTVVLMSTAGFTIDCHEMAERRADRTVILVEPNEAGGWAMYGPVETKQLVDLFDPEADESKRARVREEIATGEADLMGSGIAADRIAAHAQLPLQLVEAELKSYAAAQPGLVAKRLDGRVVLFQQGSVPASDARNHNSKKGADMPIIDRVKALFSHKGETEKKIEFLSERRAALSQQRDRSYEDMANREKQEATLKRTFAEATGDITKRRVTSQLLQLRKDVERRQQLLQVLNQQIDVVSTHLHNLELVRQGQSAQLPDGDEVAADSAKAEEMLAELQAHSELAGSVGGITASGMTDEEKALYEELQQETAAAKTPAATAARAAPVSMPSAPTRATAQESASSKKADPEMG